jgi:short-subunit dehydrogenase
MTGFRGKVVFITGASSGIGAALARELASRGADTALTARRTDRLMEVAADVRRLGRRAVVLSCDVTKDGDLEGSVAATLAELGRIDVVVANAGFGVVGRFDELTLADYRRQLETNVFGVLRTVYAALDEIKRTRGSVVIIGSVSAHIALERGSAYSMSKFAVRALAQSLSYELEPHGVGVTLISPGFVASELYTVDNRGLRRPEAVDPAPSWLRMPADKAARQIVTAVARRRRERVITGHGKAAVFLQRHVPWLLSSLVRLTEIRGRRPLQSASGDRDHGEPPTPPDAPPAR